MLHVAGGAEHHVIAAWRQVLRVNGAQSAQHKGREQLAQLLSPLRAQALGLAAGVLVPAGGNGLLEHPAEGGEVAQEAGCDQLHQSKQLTQIVLHGRAGQDDPPGGVHLAQRVQGLAAGRILQAMAFIADHEANAGSGQLLRHAAQCLVGDHQHRPCRLREAGPLRGVGCRGGAASAEGGAAATLRSQPFLDFVDPVVHQAGGAHNQRPPRDRGAGTGGGRLAEEGPHQSNRLKGLTQAHGIAQHAAPVLGVTHAHDRLKHELDALTLVGPHFATHVGVHHHGNGARRARSSQPRVARVAQHKRVGRLRVVQRAPRCRALGCRAVEGARGCAGSHRRRHLLERRRGWHRSPRRRVVVSS